MAIVLTCPQGHQWADTPHAREAESTNCPICGEAGSSISNNVELPSTTDQAPTVLPRATQIEHGNRFTVLRPHAKGGLGQVSVARDEKLGRKVALKEIRPDRLDSPYARERFLVEAEITGQLEHPGIVPI